MTLGIKVENLVGDINQDGYVDEFDYNILEQYLKGERTLDDFQKRLADIDQDGEPLSEKDLQCFYYYLKQGSTEDAKGEYTKLAGTSIGIQKLTNLSTLKSFEVRLYILRTEDYEEKDPEEYANMIISDLTDYKILPLQIKVILDQIHKYYWTIKGKFITRQPLSRDELQTIIVTINDNLRYKYALDKVNFNTLINYKEVIETILDVDNRILMVDLDPIEYMDAERNIIPKEQLTGEYSQIVPRLQNDSDDDNLHYHITLDHISVLPRFTND